MKKIAKNLILSKDYLKWLEALEGDHPAYNSSHRFIKDIKMSLLYCQKGLCAYTEELLCDPDLISLKNWNDVEYTKELNSQNLVNGDLEHFDCSLKDKQAYLWDNLFMVNSNINCRVKGTSLIYPVLKPDSSNYDAYKYLQFDNEQNVFIPNINLTQQEKDEVEHMIRTLGLNSNAFKRKKQIKGLKEDFELGLPLEKPQEYITSWEMTLKTLQEA